MTGLRISPDLELPLDAVTETIGILAVKRAGKSNAAVVLAEEMFDRGIPWVAIDPKGDWWGVRAAGSGEEPGLAVLVFGGQHGDVPLEPTAGRLVADLVVEQRVTCVLDVSEMSKADQRRFLRDFADRLYRRNSEPLHLFCEEADEYIPQMVRGEAAQVVGAFETLVKRGGFKGIGVTLVTQRSASLNKDVLTQVGTLIMLRTTSPQDQKAAEGWIKYHAGSAEVLSELAGLDNGEAWIYSPSWLQTMQKVRFRQRRTFDSGATPKVGGKPRPPTRLAEVDLAAIKEAMSATIEKARAEDPKVLRARLRELERELAGQAPPAELQEAERRIGLLQGALAGAGYAVTDVTNRLTEITAMLVEWSGAKPPVAAKEGGAVQPGPSAARSSPTPGNRTVPGTAITEEKKPAAPAGDAPRGPAGLGKAERAILTAVVRKPNSSPTVIAFLAQYSPRSSSFQNALGSLRSKDLLARGTPLRPLDGAAEALGGVEPLPTGDELRRFWLSRLGRAERAILEVLLGRYPRSIYREELAEASGYSMTSISFQNALGKLRGLGLCVRGDLLVTDELMEALGG